MGVVNEITDHKLALQLLLLDEQTVQHSMIASITNSNSSPTFLVEFATVIWTCIILFYNQATIEEPYSISTELRLFCHLTIALSLLELIAKSLGLYIIGRQCLEYKSILAVAMSLIFGVLHIAMWIYSLNKIDTSNPSASRETSFGTNPTYQPKPVTKLVPQYYLCCYRWVYGILIAGSIITIVILLISTGALVADSVRKMKNQNNNANEHQPIRQQ